MLRDGARRFYRFCWFLGELGWAFGSYCARVPFVRRERVSQARAAWLQQSSRRLLNLLDVGLDVSGKVPETGLLVCNHLSYLDILVIGATTPARFVAKSEVAKWPLFGLFARLAGTVFVNRERRIEAGRSGAELKNALKEGGVVVLFPEGTSTSGEEVLPFKSALLEPVAGAEHRVSAGCIRYSMASGSVAEEVCYWGEMTLFPHLLNLLGKEQIRARLCFSEVRPAGTERKQLARQLHSEVLRLKHTSV